jgi:hypothetical protein
MEDIYLRGTPSTPEIDFKFSEHSLSIKGDAYPDNAFELYAGAMEALRQYLANAHGFTVDVDFRIGYFNSAATKLAYTIFDMLENARLSNNKITIHWPSRGQTYDMLLTL